MRSLFITFFSFILCLPSYSKQLEYDICVYGETASGVVAAIAGAREGQKVVLISKNSHVGGMATSGLTATDMNSHSRIGGIAREFYGNIYQYYLNPDAWKNQTREAFMESTLKRTFTGKNDKTQIQWVYESHVAEEIMLNMLKEANVEILFNQRIALDKEVTKENQKITSIALEDGTIVSAKIFIDASYEGDLLAKSRISYTFGRESNKQYGETLNGIRFENSNKQFDVSPYLKENDPSSGLLPFIEPEIWGNEGDADSRTQAYCYRVTLTSDQANKVEIKKPKNYNPLWYEIIARKLKQDPDQKLTQIITITPMPNKKTDTNHLDFIGASYDYAEANYERRKEIEEMHKNYALGLLWFLGNDKRVPKHIRSKMKTWGLAKDEFLDSENFPYQIYVREGRRMVGEFVMTERNVERHNRIHAAHSIGLGTYSLDCHEVSRVATSDAKIKVDGDIYISTTPYQISYYSIVPRLNECTNLLVPVCLSASHVAYSTIRMEPVYMVLGQSAGIAASIAIKNNQPVQGISYSELRETLLRKDQVLEVK